MGSDHDNRAAIEALSSIRLELDKIAPRVMFNADECSLNHCMLLNKTVAYGALSGRKNGRERITFLLYCNYDGTEHHKPMSSALLRSHAHSRTDWLWKWSRFS